MKFSALLFAGFFCLAQLCNAVEIKFGFETGDLQGVADCRGEFRNVGQRSQDAAPDFHAFW